MGDMSSQFEGLRGDAFVERLRALAVLSSAEGKRIRCGGSGCGNAARLIGMQRCGEPGGPVCVPCAVRHAEYIASAAQIADADPYCRHCLETVDASHLYVVDLWTGEEHPLQPDLGVRDGRN